MGYKREQKETDRPLLLHHTILVFYIRRFHSKNKEIRLKLVQQPKIREEDFGWGRKGRIAIVNHGG